MLMFEPLKLMTRMRMTRMIDNLHCISHLLYMSKNGHKKAGAQKRVKKRVKNG